MSACTPDPPVPSLPVMVSMVSLILPFVLNFAAKERKFRESTKCPSYNDKRMCVLDKNRVKLVKSQQFLVHLHHKMYNFNKK
jgi:hypothetical protein